MLMVENVNKSLEAYDENMRPNEQSQQNILWHNPLDEPFQISGFAWFSEEKTYRRLPAWSTDMVREPVDHLANRSEEHTSELQSRGQLVCRRLLEKKNSEE